MTTKLHTTKSFTQEEQKTRELFAQVDWSNQSQVIANIFIAFPHMTFTCEKLEQSACALFNLHSIKLQDCLTALVRKKVLRSRKHNGQKLYEVNY